MCRSKDFDNNDHMKIKNELLNLKYMQLFRLFTKCNTTPYDINEVN